MWPARARSGKVAAGRSKLGGAQLDGGRHEGQRGRRRSRRSRRARRFCFSARCRGVSSGIDDAAVAAVAAADLAATTRAWSSWRTSGAATCTRRTRAAHLRSRRRRCRSNSRSSAGSVESATSKRRRVFGPASVAASRRFDALPRGSARTKSRRTAHSQSPSGRSTMSPVSRCSRLSRWSTSSSVESIQAT